MNRTILVTGGAGYIGSQLIRDLAMDPAYQGCTIRIYDNMQRGTYQALMDLPPFCHYQLVEGDVMDRYSLAEAMQGVWAVIHLAAIVKTPLSFDHPTWTHQVNHWGTVTVIDEAVRAGVERFIYACSASVYGPGGPFRENDPCHPVGPYSTSKLQGEAALLGAGQQRGLRGTSLRFGTVFGYSPGARFDAFVNRMAYLAGVGKPIVVNGKGDQKRPILHVRDATAAILFCLSHPETIGKVYNAAAENVSILGVAEAIQAILPTARVHFAGQDILTAMSFEVDSSELMRQGWMPQFSVEAGINEILQRLSLLHEPGTAYPGQPQVLD